MSTTVNSKQDSQKPQTALTSSNSELALSERKQPSLGMHKANSLAKENNIMSRVDKIAYSRYFAGK